MIMKKRQYSREKQKKAAGYAYTLPAVIFMLGLIGYPTLYNWYISFTNMSIKNYNAGTIKFIGLKNYLEIFHDSKFLDAFGHTLKFTVVCIVFQFIIGLLLAILFSQQFWGAGKLRGFLTISWLVPATVTALMFKYMLSSDGVINFLLMKTGIINQGIPWLTDIRYALLGLIIANIWVGVPFNMLLLSTGISNIPQDIIESARVDGANVFQRFFYITIPVIKSSILSTLVLGFVYTFKVFDLVFTMTGGGPANSTEVLSTYSYYHSFKLYDFGTGTAMANVLFVVLFIIALFYLKLIGDEN